MEVDPAARQEASLSAVPPVSIVIPVYGHAFYTRLCFLALPPSIPGWPAVEVVVVDNGSDAETAALLDRLAPPYHVLRQPANAGFAPACNRGAALARGRWLVFLNNDTVPQPGWLDALVAEAERAGAGIAGSKLLYPDGTIQHAGVGFHDDGSPFVLHHCRPADWPEANRPRDVRAVTGAALLVDRALFADLGGFDERYLNGYEDLDLCCRARERGQCVRYVPDSVLYHFGSVAAGRFAAHDRNAALFEERWGETLRREGEPAVPAPPDSTTGLPEETGAAPWLDVERLAAQVEDVRGRLVGYDEFWLGIRLLIPAYRELLAEYERLRAAFAEQAAWARDLERRLLALQSSQQPAAVGRSARTLLSVLLARVRRQGRRVAGRGATQPGRGGADRPGERGRSG